MLSSHDQKRHRNGMVLVALQFGLLLVLAVMAASRVRRGDVPAAAWLLAASSVALAAWALLHNRLGNFNIRPAPKQMASSSPPGRTG
jgi:hypothetical protein